MVLQTHPAEKQKAEGKVEEALVGYGENDEGWSELQEDDYESVDVVIVWLKTMEHRNE